MYGVPFGQGENLGANRLAIHLVLHLQAGADGINHLLDLPIHAADVHRAADQYAVASGHIFCGHFWGLI